MTDFYRYKHYWHWQMQKYGAHWQKPQLPSTDMIRNEVEARLTEEFTKREHEYRILSVKTILDKWRPQFWQPPEPPPDIVTWLLDGSTTTIFECDIPPKSPAIPLIIGIIILAVIAGTSVVLVNYLNLKTIETRRTIVELTGLPPEPEKYPCPYCAEIFESDAERTAHIREAHPEQPVYCCRWCSACFNTPEERTAHEKEVHEREPPPPEADNTLLILMVVIIAVAAMAFMSMMLVRR